MKKIILYLATTIIFPFFIFSCSSNGKDGKEKTQGDTLDSVKTKMKEVKETLPAILVIQGKNVNIRVGPSLDAVCIRQLKTGDTCNIIEKGKQETIDSKTDFWYRIKNKSTEGWVFGAFSSLKLSDNKAKETKTIKISKKKYYGKFKIQVITRC